ncbi:MAG: AAA family ATPase [Oscillospiraceae bacterium]|nr:AAA family ATPase [Oscillospiraceae bacterium]
MAKVLTFFNHKGGVGKTTLAYNVAWGLSCAGQRVLMIDADAQCNLTEIAVGDKRRLDPEDGQLSLFPDTYNPEFFVKNNIYTFLSQYVHPSINRDIPQVKMFEKRERLSLLPGALKLAELEETLALSLAGIRALRDVPDAVYSALKMLGESQDWIIIDLSPALSATNQLFLMLSDYFIVPVSPSVFSKQALDNLGEIFRGWNRNLSSFEFYKQLPKMLGIVCLNYRPYSRKDEDGTKSAKRFEESMKELNERAVKLAEDLNGFRMALSATEFYKLFPNEIPFRIASIPDYNQLSVISDKENIPVHGIKEFHLKKHEMNTPYYRDKIEDFQGACANIVNGLLQLP